MTKGWHKLPPKDQRTTRRNNIARDLEKPEFRNKVINAKRKTSKYPASWLTENYDE